MSDLMRQSAKLSARLNAIPQEVVKHLRPALIASAENTAGVMRSLVPVDEGDLKASIEVTPPGATTPAYAAGGGRRMAGENQALVTAGNPDVRHGHLQEFGTVDHPAQPFLRPAERLTRDQNRRRIGRAVGQAIRKAGV
ncbi:MAG: HK97 gp10 family phage protein [Rhodobacteraceae bacterium]|nr:HK97 gp10 family phage protein [Paracoccaceae bacterium]MCF8512979.1 HK97 gp10 family phage protein [Paracoccaceae bacterium]MCF8517224.1 HK97 gp10 family phage protein [Paracoccaceae bacterium]